MESQTKDSNSDSPARSVSDGEFHLVRKSVRDRLLKYYETVGDEDEDEDDDEEEDENGPGGNAEALLELLLNPNLTFMKRANSLVIENKTLLFHLLTELEEVEDYNETQDYSDDEIKRRHSSLKARVSQNRDQIASNLQRLSDWVEGKTASYVEIKDNTSTTVDSSSNVSTTPEFTTMKQAIGLDTAKSWAVFVKALHQRLHDRGAQSQPLHHTERKDLHNLIDFIASKQPCCQTDVKQELDWLFGLDPSEPSNLKPATKSSVSNKRVSIVEHLADDKTDSPLHSHSGPGKFRNESETFAEKIYDAKQMQKMATLDDQSTFSSETGCLGNEEAIRLWSTLSGETPSQINKRITIMGSTVKSHKDASMNERMNVMQTPLKSPTQQSCGNDLHPLLTPPLKEWQMGNHAIITLGLPHSKRTFFLSEKLFAMKSRKRFQERLSEIFPATSADYDLSGPTGWYLHPWLFKNTGKSQYRSLHRDLFLVNERRWETKASANDAAL